MDLKEFEQIVPHIKVDGMTYYTPNSACAWRVETLYTKEPDTIEWMRSMAAGEVMYDVGANVGMYTIFAAKLGIEVYAFEPESQNYAVLNRNIVLNELTNAYAYPVCFGSEFAIDTLRISLQQAGGSCHQFGVDKNYRGQEKQFELKQGSLSMMLDDFARYIKKWPDHIKIDVDGLEPEVIRGSRSALIRCKSVLIELDQTNEEHRQCHDYMLSLGFAFNAEQVEQSRRKDGPFKDIGNRIYRRGV